MSDRIMMELREGLAIIDESTIPEFDWFILEGYLNVYWHEKKFPLLMKCEEITPDVMRVSIRGYAIALYIRSRNELYRCEGSLQRQWMMVKSGFGKMYENLKVVS